MLLLTVHHIIIQVSQVLFKFSVQFSNFAHLEAVAGSMARRDISIKINTFYFTQVFYVVM